jgi:hypothetical protein
VTDGVVVGLLLDDSDAGDRGASELVLILFL